MRTLSFTLLYALAGSPGQRSLYPQISKLQHFHFQTHSMLLLQRQRLPGIYWWDAQLEVKFLPTVGVGVGPLHFQFLHVELWLKARRGTLDLF